MAGIKEYSTTPLSNSSINSISIAEGCAPSGINDAIRQAMADTRSFYESGGWIDLGYTHTYASSTSVTVSGTDVTSYYPASRRIKAVGSGTGTIYGKVASSSFSTNTTINFTWDSGSLSNESLTVSVGFISPTGSPSGDVSGPASSTADALVLFNGTGGKTIKDSAYTITAAGAALLDDASASAQRTTLGLGTAAVLASDTDTTLAANSDSNVATQKAVKTYVSTVPQNSKSAAYTTVLTDAGKHIFHPSADTTARTFTIDSNANVAYPIGTAITFVNQNGAGVVTIAITSDTMRLAGAGTTGSRTLAANGIATALKVTSTEWIISGTGLT